MQQWIDGYSLSLAASVFTSWHTHNCTYSVCPCNKLHLLTHCTHRELKAHLYTGALEQLCGLNWASFMCRKVSGWGSRLSYVASGCRGIPWRRRVSTPRISQAAPYCSDSPADTLASWNASFSRFPAKSLQLLTRIRVKGPASSP